MSPTPENEHSALVRLQKVLAEAGLGSRRACERIITDGRVTVNGRRVTILGTRVDPVADAIQVDGMPVRVDPAKVTIALNKPEGVVATMEDPEGRPTVAEYVYNRHERLFHVGRLDIESEGLLLLTNDGELANRLTHPSHQVPKTYLATVEGRVPPGIGRQLRDGIELDDGPVSVDSFRLVDSTPSLTMVEIVLHSGRYRVVRRMMEALGFPVVRLVRTRIGPIALGDLKPGRTRVLSKPEVTALMRDVGM